MQPCCLTGSGLGIFLGQPSPRLSSSNIGIPRCPHQHTAFSLRIYLHIYLPSASEFYLSTRSICPAQSEVRFHQASFNQHPLTRQLFTGVLIECDPSVKAIILKYDEERHDYIVEDLDDDRHLVIKESQLENLKFRLGKVIHTARRGTSCRAPESNRNLLTCWVIRSSMIRSCNRTSQSRNNCLSCASVMLFCLRPRPRLLLGNSLFVAIDTWISESSTETQ